MVKLLTVLSVLFTITLSTQVELKKTKANITKVGINNGDTIVSELPYSYIAISESDSTLLVGNIPYDIVEIEKDSVVTYSVKETEHKKFVWDESKSSLTQKNIMWQSRGVEVWFVYKIIGSKNEFEF